MEIGLTIIISVIVYCFFAVIDGRTNELKQTEYRVVILEKTPYDFTEGRRQYYPIVYESKDYYYITEYEMWNNGISKWNTDHFMMVEKTGITVSRNNILSAKKPF